MLCNTADARRPHSGLERLTTPKCFNICQWNPRRGRRGSAGGFRWHLTTAPGGPDLPLWWKRDVSAQNTSMTRGRTSRRTPGPALVACPPPIECQSPPLPHAPYLEGSQKPELVITRCYLLRSLRFNLWFTAQSALEDPRTQHQKKGEEMSFIASSLSIKRRPYQRPAPLLKTPQAAGQITSDRLIEFWQTAHK